MPRNRLSDMAYNEVSFVDKGANLDRDGETGAHIMLFKRDTEDIDKGNPTPGDLHTEVVPGKQGGKKVVTRKCKCGATGPMGKTCPECGEMNMGKKSLTKALGEFLQTVDEIEKDATVLDDLDVDALEDDLEDDDFLDGDDEDEQDPDDDEDVLVVTVQDDNSDQEGDMPDIGKIDKSALGAEVRQYIEGLEQQVAKKGTTPDEDIFKGMSPEAVVVVKRAQADATAAQERIAKMEEAQDRASYATIAKSLESLPVGDDTGPALMSLAKADETAYTEVMRLLKAADEQVRSSNLFKSIGTSTSGSTDLDAKVAARATEIAKADGVPMTKARAQAWDEFSNEYDQTEGKVN